MICSRFGVLCQPITNVVVLPTYTEQRHVDVGARGMADERHGTTEDFPRHTACPYRARIVYFLDWS